MCHHQAGEPKEYEQSYVANNISISIITFVLLLTFSSDSSLIKAFEQVPNALLAQLANANIQ
jgi:hypothetical protein